MFSNYFRIYALLRPEPSGVTGDVILIFVCYFGLDRVGVTGDVIRVSVRCFGLDRVAVTGGAIRASVPHFG